MSKISVTTIAGLTSGGDANKVKIESGDDFIVDTDTLYVNSSTNGVGVGTTTPSNFGGSTIQVNHASSYSSLLASSGTHVMQFMASQANGVTNMGSRSNHPVSITTNDTPKLTINTTGHVTMPNQPCFSATHNTGGNLTTDTTYRVKPFNTTLTNVGGGYNNSTNRFTAPVAGNYFFYSYGLQLANVSSNLIFGKNGSHTTHGTNAEGRAITPSGSEMNVAIQLVIPLAVNDYVEVFYRRTGGSGNWYSAHAGFSGFLIG